MTENTIPPGYWADANGTLTPISKIKEIDKDRTRLVEQLCAQAEAESARLAGFKLSLVNAINDFLGRSAAVYGVELRGTKGKGNVTLTTYSGHYKIVRQVQESLVFDERLQTAKVLIDECIQSWSKGSNANIKALVNNAFQVDRQGKISTGRVLGLRSIEIVDEKWALAMQAIGDSMRVASTKSYVRLYKREDSTGEYFPINLDVAAL